MQPAQRESSGHDLPAVATLASGTLFSRLLGFIRDIAFTALLGPAADIFLIAFRIPNFFRKLLADGSLGIAYGAAATRLLSRHGHEALGVFGRYTSSRLFLFGLPLAILFALCAKPLVLLLAPGLSDKAAEECIFLMRLCLPYIPLCLLSATAFSHMAALGNFMPQAWSSGLWNCVILLTAGLAGLLVVSGVTLSPPDIQTFLCVGVVAGGIAQASLGIFYLSKSGTYNEISGVQDTVSSSPPASVRSESLALLRQFPAAAAGAAGAQIHFLAAMALASFTATGGISGLYLSERLVELPVSLAGSVLGLAVLPGLARLAAQEKKKELAETLGQSLRRGAFISFPATAGLMAMAFPLADTLFGHGSFTKSSVLLTASALIGYAPAIPALCAARPLLAAVTAFGHRTAPLSSACVSLAPLLTCGITGIYFWGETYPEYCMIAIGLGLSVGAWANTWLLSRKLHTVGVPSPLYGIRRTLTAYIVAALGMGSLLGLGICWLGQPGTLGCLVLVSIAGVAWIVFFRALKNQDAQSLLGLFRYRKQK